LSCESSREKRKYEKNAVNHFDSIESDVSSESRDTVQGCFEIRREHVSSTQSSGRRDAGRESVTLLRAPANSPTPRVPNPCQDFRDPCAPNDSLASSPSSTSQLLRKANLEGNFGGARHPHQTIFSSARTLLCHCSRPHSPQSYSMAASRLFRPATRLLSQRPTSIACRSAFRATASIPSVLGRRTYATPSGVKEVTVRDALNEALAEELERDEKVFVLGEEVAQYNGA
jgi:hypothetical protein